MKISKFYKIPKLTISFNIQGFRQGGGGETLNFFFFLGRTPRPLSFWTPPLSNIPGGNPDIVSGKRYTGCLPIAASKLGLKTQLQSPITLVKFENCQICNMAAIYYINIISALTIEIKSCRAKLSYSRCKYLNTTSSYQPLKC